MNFLRLSDPLLQVLFEDEDIIAIDKPYGFNAHTNDSKIEHSELIQDGLIEIFEKQRGKKLHIIHRLDQTTTGVMIFGKSVESAKKYAEYFFNRQVKKTYWFITKSESAEKKFCIDQSILHKGRELDAKTDLSQLETQASFELWEAHPKTGRNHQIRIHAKVAGIPILGDQKYSGAVFPFLCLHNHRIEFPNGIVIVSEPPAYFKNLSWLQESVLIKTLFEVDRRQRLFSFSPKASLCFRWRHSSLSSKDTGWNLDQLGPIAILNWMKERWGEEETAAFQAVSMWIQKPILVRRSGGQALLWIDLEKKMDSESLTWIAEEEKMRFEIRAESGSIYGPSLDQRLQRNWLFHHAKGKTVLNLFSSMGGYSLAAALGGASSVLSVDLGKNALNWTRKNFELNGLDPQNFQFFCRDSLSFIEQSRNKNLKYDVITCDAPSFYRRERGVFKLDAEVENLLGGCLYCLNPGGALLFSTHMEELFLDDLRKLIEKVQNHLKISQLEINSLFPSLDFELPEEKTLLKSFLIQVGG
ncbi:MAG: hypothetical protein COT73_03750 [Bdellovibrio sp. CG10_big_fil_rev_8_21_14_0_10_47_8]|nr:MAG: hypothetical protein COT73_03750 [Bdellovibrio sp. CG10_big_fil_rev_8_21_14_0_10_47_8]